MKNYKKAYILSTVHGTVQIGTVVYCVPTGERFKASMKGLKNYPYVLVDGNGFEAAKTALRVYGSIDLSRNLTRRVLRCIIYKLTKQKGGLEWKN